MRCPAHLRHSRSPSLTSDQRNCVGSAPVSARPPAQMLQSGGCSAATSANAEVSALVGGGLPAQLPRWRCIY
eukprot:8563658-Pyramimonas_sp.AAC.1